jgi:hypothetical protein
MFEQLQHVARDPFGLFLAECARCARALGDWFRSEDDPEERSLKLMREWLSPEQLAQYEANRYFDVTGCDSGKRYRIHHGASMNIFEIDATGCPGIGWCFVPDAYLPAGDVMLAQKIALETDERAALAVATQFAPKEKQQTRVAVPRQTQRNMFVY